MLTMNLANIATVLSEAAVETLETMAFMEVTLKDLAASDLDEARGYWATITLHQPLQGQLTLFVPTALGEEIAATLLGVDEADPPSEEVIRDSMAEVVNTIAGLAMGRLAGNQLVEIGLPVSEKGSGPSPQKPDLVCGLTMGEYAFALIAQGLR